MGDSGMLDENIQAKLTDACAKARIVFWEDVSGEFAQDVRELDLPGVTVVDVRGCALATKRRVLRDERNGRFLLYRAGGAPCIEEDFLLDVKALAQPFSATQSASWAEDTGLPIVAAKVVSAHAAFFASKERRAALRELVEQADWMRHGYSDDGLVLSLLSVCCGSKSIHRVDAVRDMAARALEQYAKNSDDLMRLLERCGLTDAFWQALATDLGYCCSKTPGLEDFAFEAMLSACSDLTGEVPTLSPDVAIVISDIANDPRKSDVFTNLVDATCDYVTSKCNLEALPTEVLAAHRYLPVVDSIIIRRIANDVTQGVDCSSQIAEVRARRASGRFFSNWSCAYDALIGAAGVLALAPRFESEIGSVDDARACFDRYVFDWSAIDESYRMLCLVVSKAVLLMADVFEPLAHQVELSYARYCNRLSAAWQRLVVERGSWPVNWEDASQRRFFEDKVHPELASKRVAVVVSDALRYEAGADWSRRVADRGRCQVECSAMLASLPTYTQLGMASLLPNQTLSIDPKTLTATVDGADATGAQHREQILRREVPNAVVLSYEELFDQEGAERLGGAKLAYVYHNIIDMTGDKRDSEERTFAAVDETFDQLDRACARLFQLGFSCVFVVADHGFLYQRDSKSFDFAEVPFLGVAVGTDNAKQSRRFVVANDLPACDALIELGASELGLSGDYTCEFPKGTRRMRLSGSGARFAHGGMTLQEAVVPCVRLTRAKARGSATPVGVDLLTGGTKVITGSFVRFEIFQTDPVGDGVLPVSLQVGLYDAQGQLRSETKPIEVASSSPNAEERRIPVMLTVAQDVANGARLTLRVDQRYGTTSKYKTVAQADYIVRRNFGLDF